jgi:GH25 family lysozyme M1 (1,4-beta-N-acetylmuramidase)
MPVTRDGELPFERPWIWQYTAQGVCHGISGRVDKNLMLPRSA